MRLIDADELIDELKRDKENCCMMLYSFTEKEIYNDKIEYAMDRIKDTPTVEANPLIYATILSDEDGNIECSNCGSLECWGNFCMNCGAKMTERKANEDSN